MYIDAVSIDWSDLKFYAFSPISVIPRALSKVKQNSAEGIIIVPFWSTEFGTQPCLICWHQLQFC